LSLHIERETFIDASPEEKIVFTAFIILSYIQELFDTLPYLYLVGDNESGKTHLLNLMSGLCYRPLAGISHTAADLYSYLEDYIPLTIIEDEFLGLGFNYALTMAIFRNLTIIKNSRRVLPS